ncbi:MAG: hypothetical protein ACYSR7_05645 [Planctomycetota bacterium]
MKLITKRLKKLTMVSVAAYVFMFAVCAKGVSFYANQHPLKEELLSVHGIIKDVRLGGQGKATSLQIKSEHGTHRYSSYYGKVWRGMERIQSEDRVDLLAERNRLNKNEFIAGKRYYIWELIHRNQIIINYEDVRKMIQGKEAIVNRYINLWLATGFFFLVVVYLHKIIFSKTPT